MVDNCCKLVGNFDALSLHGGCVISINSNINTTFPQDCFDDLSEGASVGSLNISGYVGSSAHKGCHGRASVQVTWLRKYDCSANNTHFIFTGAGRSFIYGDSSNCSISLERSFTSTTKLISASAQSGPTSLYTDIEQQEGIGMSFSGGPINFNTNSESSCKIANLGIGISEYYLQNFNIEFVPGSIPVANYSFAFSA